MVHEDMKSEGDRMVELIWWGHACFEIRCCNKSLLIDPHDGGSLGPGFQPPRAKPDYIIVTHEHYDHNAVESVQRDDTIVVRERVGEFELGPFRIRGVKLPHDEFEGKLRGFVVAYQVEVEGLNITHLSDAGRPPRGDESQLLRADIVLAPAGNVYTMHPRKALEAAAELGARVLVPMHYWVPGMQLPLDPLENLLRYAKKWRVVRYDSNQVAVSRDELPDTRTILVLSLPQ